MKILALLLCVIPAAACATAPSAAPRGPLAPLPVRVQSPEAVAILVGALGHDRFEKREAASAELQQLGMKEGSQAAMVDALRGAATSADAEVRSRARAILAAIDRSEGMIPSGTMNFSAGANKVRLELRYFADGSVELQAKVDEDPEELFSGKDMPELARRVNQAARNRGYPEEVFAMSPDGSFKMGGSTMTVGSQPEEHLVVPFAIWANRVPATDRTIPETARGSWQVKARMLGGRGFRAGLRVGDFIVEIDGKRPDTFDEFRRLLESAKSVRVVRLQAVEALLTP
jgi:hypothetical protein